MSFAGPNYRLGRHQRPDQYSLEASRLPEDENTSSREPLTQSWHGASVFAATDVSPRLRIPSDSFPFANGGFCWLYWAELMKTEQFGPQQSTHSEVAVKIYMSKNDASRKLARTRVAREAVVLMAAQHPFVVEFYGTAVMKGHPALVLKWYGNGDATHALEGKSAVQKLQIIKDIAAAMEYLHSKNIVHGDLKGNNVLVSDEGRGILTDFGLSHFTDGHTGYTTSSSSATIPWLSPELATQFLNTDLPEPTICDRTMASDIWAFGSTAFELLSGRTPYEHLRSATSLPVLRAISRGISPRKSCPSTVIEPAAIISVLDKCWQVEPSLRSSMADVVKMLSML